jgi:hypothetical protein
MHISLDSALGQQRRLNSVGESITQIAPDPAAAYSLRSLTGGDPKVVRVRRGSDNHEQDFTASDVSSGALQDFVNAQVVAPLDIQALSATGRDGDFLIAKAAYSLRSLGTRQATLAATGDTVARADGKYVCQVRRSSDNALKSFTADEITDGTLLSFVGTSGLDHGFVKTWYDQSVSDQAGNTPTGNHATQTTAANQPKIVNAGSLLTLSGKPTIKPDGTDDFLINESSIWDTISNSALSCFTLTEKSSVTNKILWAIGSSSSEDGDWLIGGAGTTGHVQFRGGRINSANSSIGTSGTVLLTALDVSGGDGFVNGTAIGSPSSTTPNVTADRLVLFNRRGSSSSSTFTDQSLSEVIFYGDDQTDNRTAIEANMGEVYSIDLPSGVDPGFDQVDGFVETWYDQSGNGRDSTQTTAARQPIIVDAGTFQDGLKFTHDDTTNGKRLSVPRSAAELGDTFALVWVGKITVSDSSYNTVLGGTRGVSSFAPGTAGLTVKSSTGNVAFINEETTSDREVSISSTTISLNTDAVIFATYEDAEAGPDLDLSVNGNKQDFGYGSNLILTSSKDIGIMHGSSSGGSYRTQESPVGICREVLAYDTAQFDNRVDLETNIINHYGIS